MVCPYKKAAIDTFSGNAYCYKDRCICDWIDDTNYNRCSTFEKGYFDEKAHIDKGQNTR